MDGVNSGGHFLKVARGSALGRSPYSRLGSELTPQAVHQMACPRPLCPCCQDRLFLFTTYVRCVS